METHQAQKMIQMSEDSQKFPLLPPKSIYYDSLRASAYVPPQVQLPCRHEVVQLFPRLAS
ncbi:hypothetical protein GQ43DRAFT_445002 [Delitschia confertaspora ATCC 74209]|uniref:Uncharacterized protein n=1 Tax=Delitschia confertaspora ATCC 74209 TaxID=1513339 RepID=A0A9P4MMX8_9PLEO|nr:hypothetical protein GQ43DRAFT_445002 [Delitschia confertaspora ATCC 74209]